MKDYRFTVEVKGLEDDGGDGGEVDAVIGVLSDVLADDLRGGGGELAGHALAYHGVDRFQRSKATESAC